MASIFIRWLWVAILCFGICMQKATAKEHLPADVMEALRSSEIFVLYSLDANSYLKGTGFHGYKIVGHLSPDKETRQRITAKIAADSSGDGGAFCFLPHHGVRVFYEKRLYDLVICYLCGNMHIHTSGRAKRHVGIGGQPDELDQILKKAKVPLATREYVPAATPKQWKPVTK